jgi:hypothetical protein
VALEEIFMLPNRPSSTTVRTNVIQLPHRETQFSIGQSEGVQALGVLFPREWFGARFYGLGLYRFRISFTIAVQKGDLAPDDIARQLLEDLEFRVVSAATGPASLYIPAESEIVPYLLDVESSSFDFVGVAPGKVGVDAYSVSARIDAYWKPVQSASTPESMAKALQDIRQQCRQLRRECDLTHGPIGPLVEPFIRRIENFASFMEGTLDEQKG